MHGFPYHATQVHQILKLEVIPIRIFEFDDSFGTKGSQWNIVMFADIIHGPSLTKTSFR